MVSCENRQIINFHQDKNTYRLDVAIEKSFVLQWDSFFFALFQRHTNRHEILPHQLKLETKEFYIYHLEISLEVYRNFFLEGETIDLSVVRTSSGEESRSRIKSNYKYLEFFWQCMDDGHILRPVTTREGNVSFYVRENNMLAICEEIQLTEEGTLALKGMYHYGGLTFQDVRKIELVATSNVQENEIIIPVQPMELPDSYKDYSWYEELQFNGFGAKFDIKKSMILGNIEYFKFHLRVVYEKNGNPNVIESMRIKVSHNNQKYPITKKLMVNTDKIKITARPTRKSKYLSVRVSEYKLPAEIMQNIRKNWVSIRRSKKLLQLYKTAFYLFGVITPADKKLVMFESFHGKQYSDSPRAIYEYMKESGTDYRLIWSVDRRHLDYFKGKDVLFVRRFSVRWLLLMTRAKYWVTNARLPLWIPKPKHTVYLQTWHGTPLKRLAADMDEVHMPGTNIIKYKENFTKEASKWNYLVSPNAYSTKIFRRAFQFDQKMIESGYPRNDYLYTSNNEDAVRRLKQNVGLPDNKKVILYAPTWRDNQFYGRGRYKFNLELDLDKLQEKFGETHIIVLRMHYLVAENLDIEAYKGFVFDFSSYEDIRDLYLVSDLLITDYSSVFFDYANLRRPILFFVYDIEDYRDNLRGFYFDLEKNAPGPLARTTEELISEITKIEKEGFIPSPLYNQFYERFCYLEDGKASERVVKEVFGE